MSRIQIPDRLAGNATCFQDHGLAVKSLAVEHFADTCVTPMQWCPVCDGAVVVQ
jgi:hypothetical protein